MPPLMNQGIQIQHTFPEIAATLTSPEQLFSFENLWWGLWRFRSWKLRRYGSITEILAGQDSAEHLHQTAGSCDHSPEKELSLGGKD